MRPWQGFKPVNVLGIVLRRVNLWIMILRTGIEGPVRFQCILHDRMYQSHRYVSAQRGMGQHCGTQASAKWNFFAGSKLRWQALKFEKTRPCGPQWRTELWFEPNEQVCRMAEPAANWCHICRKLTHFAKSSARHLPGRWRAGDAAMIAESPARHGFESGLISKVVANPWRAGDWALCDLALRHSCDETPPSKPPSSKPAIRCSPWEVRTSYHQILDLILYLYESNMFRDWQKRLLCSYRRLPAWNALSRVSSCSYTE